MLDNYNEPFKGEEDYYSGQKLRHQSFLQRHRGFVIITGVLVLLLAIFVTSTLYLLTSHTQTTTTSPSPQTVPSQTLSANTPVSSTSGPVAAPTPTVLATVTAGTFTEPNGGLKLHTNADDPITVTITSITFNPNENKMVWSLVLMNVDSSDQHVYGYGSHFSLKSDVEGDNYTHQASEIQDTDIPPGNQVQETITFTFVPYQKASGVSYTLTSSIQNNYLVPNSITFDPITMTF